MAKKIKFFPLLMALGISLLAWADHPCEQFLQRPPEKEFTLALVRPEAMSELARIESAITRNGLTIEYSGLWETRSLDEKRYFLEAFYDGQSTNRYFPLIVGNMLKGDSQILIISGKNAVARLNDLVGEPDPFFAAKGTLRQAYGKDMVANGIHASANIYAAADELKFFFSKIPWASSQSFWKDIENWQKKVKREEFTLGLIKPEAVEAGHADKIMALIEKHGLKIVAAKQVQLQKEQAEQFYQEHQGKGFFHDLVSYMTSGPIYILMIKGQNAVRKYRGVLGATDPAKAVGGTIRKLYGTSKSFNAAHGSDSLNSALRELKFFAKFFTTNEEKAAVAPVSAYVGHVVQSEYTLALIEPSALQGSSPLSVAAMLAEHGLEVLSMPQLKLKPWMAERFFQAEKNRPNFSNFVNYMSSRPIYALIIRAPEAVVRLQKLLGHPQPAFAEAGTVRQMLWPNFPYPQAIYGSNSVEQGQKDVGFVLSLTPITDAALTNPLANDAGQDEFVRRDFQAYQQRLEMIAGH